MSPTRWAVPRAFCLAFLAVMFSAATASAQYYDSALRSFDFTAGLLARSPRLQGMGGLTLAVPDRNTALNLWDFAGMPVGLAADDTTSTLDVRPGTDAFSSISHLPSGLERQSLAARSTQAQAEAVYRSRESGGLFGLVGDLSGLHWDQTYSSTVELRQGLTHPQVMPILAGIVPRFFDRHLAWAAYMRFRDETVDDRYRSIVSNAAGEYIDLGGAELPPPSEFVPTQTNVNTVAYGLSTAYTMGRVARLGLGVEHENNEVLATNDLSRSSSEIRETRPYWVGHAALVGMLGRSLEYGVDGIGRTADSEQDWRFTTSAGVGAIPLTGRGNLLTREEKSSEFKGHARWTHGHAALAGAFHSAAQDINIDPPNANDETSFNRFINTAFNRPGADTLAFPDSVVRYEFRRRAWGWGGGASYKFGLSTLGAEFNWERDVSATLALGSGPRRITWDVRTGYEHPLGDRMMARLGYLHRWVDQDDYTANNEYVSNAATVGFGYAPAASSWELETAFQLEFSGSDWNDPTDSHQSRQRLALQIHWAF
jgi:hypothetical protein